MLSYYIILYCFILHYIIIYYIIWINITCSCIGYNITIPCSWDLHPIRIPTSDPGDARSRPDRWHVSWLSELIFSGRAEDPKTGMVRTSWDIQAVGWYRYASANQIWQLNIQDFICTVDDVPFNSQFMMHCPLPSFITGEYNDYSLC